jgi:hypothetical protein
MWPQNLLRLHHPPLPLQAGSHPAPDGSGKVDPARPQGGDVGLSGRVAPHPGVHSRCQQNRTGRRQGQGGEEIVRQAPGQFGHRVGRRRGDDQQVGGVGQPDVRDVGGQSSPAGMPEVGVDRSARQRLKGQGGDEASRRLGHHHVHFRPHLGQVAGQGADFVDGDAAGDAQENALPAQQRDGFHVAPFTNRAPIPAPRRRSCRLKSRAFGRQSAPTVT